MVCRQDTVVPTSLRSAAAEKENYTSLPGSRLKPSSLRGDDMKTLLSLLLLHPY